MEKYKRLSVIFSTAYVIILIILLVEFFAELFTTGNVDFRLLIPIIAGSVTYTILTIVIREKDSINE